MKPLSEETRLGQFTIEAMCFVARANDDPSQRFLCFLPEGRSMKEVVYGGIPMTNVVMLPPDWQERLRRGAT